MLEIERPIDIEVAKARKKLSHYFLDANFKVVEIQDFIYDYGSKLGYTIKAWDQQKNFYKYFSIGLVRYKTQATHDYKLESIHFLFSDGLKEFQRNNWYPQYSWTQFINEDYMTINEKNWKYLEYNIAQDLWYNINESQIEKSSKIKSASTYELKRFSPEVLIACESGTIYKNGKLAKFENRKNEDSGHLQLKCEN